jgi:hypothetical protein
MAAFRRIPTYLAAGPIWAALVLAGAGLSVSLPGPAAARTPIAEMLCSIRSSMEQRLANQFRAQRTAMGIRDADSVMEVWTEPATGDWTMVVTYASGTSCIVAMGSSWEMQGAPPASSDAG